MKELILIKLGGSLITDKSKPYSARNSVINRLAKEVKSALKTKKARIIIANGSGSFGHSAASIYKTQEGIINKNSLKGFSVVADAAIQINRIVINEFLKFGLPVVSFSPLSFIIASEKNPRKLFIEPLINALNLGLIPVIYGDVVIDYKRGFCILSGEKTLTILAKKLKSDYTKIRIIYCGDTDGVLDKYGKTIPLINDSVFNKIRKDVKGSKAIDVTGGMLHKVQESLISAKIGTKILIINGMRINELEKAILEKGYKGTLVK